MRSDGGAAKLLGGWEAKVLRFLFDQGEAAFARPGRALLSVPQVIARAFGRRAHAPVETRSLGLADRRPGSVRVTKSDGLRSPGKP